MQKITVKISLIINLVLSKAQLNLTQRSYFNLQTLYKHLFNVINA